MTRTRRTKLFSVMFPALAALGGCLPEKRIVWSPDGERAAVCSATGLYFVDMKGEVLAPRLESGSPATCDWFADGRRLAVMHGAKAPRWDDIADLFDKEQLEEIRKCSTELRDRILAFEGDLDEFDKDQPPGKHSSEMEIAILMYMRDKDNAGLRDKLKDDWEKLAKIEAEIRRLQLYELKGNELVPGKALWRTLASTGRPRVSPNGRFIALVRSGVPQADDSFSLWVIPVDDGACRLVAQRVSIDFDWSPDSRSLAFIRSSDPDSRSGDNISLGTLTTVRVAGADGALLAEWAEKQDRVGLLFNQALGVDWLSDGRLLFASVEVNLPATTRDMPQHWTLFALDPRTPASVTRVLGRDFPEPLDLELPLFEVSPDETRVLLPSPKERYSIYDFASGKTINLIDSEIPEAKMRCLATWRNAGEVSFVQTGTGTAATDGAVQPQAQVYLWKAGKAHCISDKWPAELRAGWLDEK